MLDTSLARTEPHALSTAEVVDLDQHPAAVYLARLGSARSRQVLRGALDTIARLLTQGRCDAFTLAWPTLRYQHTTAVRAQLAERYAAATANQHLSALRGVLKECWRLGYTTAEDYHRAADLAPVRGSVLPRGRGLKGGEIRALFNVCADDDGPAGIRDAALLTVLYGAGLRRAEAVGLDLADYDPETGALVIRGKGNKQRIGYITHGGRLALEEWLTLRGPEPGPLFWGVDKAGQLRPRRLTGQAVRFLAGRRGATAKVQAFSPHDLRRSFISDLLDAGADISTVQQLAGHAQVQTTQRYDRRGEGTKQKAATLIHVPYTPRRRPGAA